MIRDIIFVLLSDMSLDAFRPVISMENVMELISGIMEAAIREQQIH